VLDGPPDLKEAIAKGAKSPKRRLVSSAGPAVPVMKSQSDTVPNGWMARLEAARAMAAQSLASGQTEAPAPPPAPPPPMPDKPPPLATIGTAPKKKAGEIEAKPAHLLVAQLQQDEASRREREAKELKQLFVNEDPDAISSMQVEVPKEVERKRIPDWAIVLVLVLAVLGGIAFVYQKTQKEPAPVAKIDPKLEEAAKRKKEAILSLEEGHRYVLEGKDSADKAIAAYTKALHLEPTLAGAERGLAIAFTGKDDKTSAVVHYKRYLELDPTAKDVAEVKKIIESYEKAAAKKP
jgi:tetratricopeptide (TPR) repeat protein